MVFLKRFIFINRKLSKRIEGVLPHTKPDLTSFYSQVVAQKINLKNDQIIVDVGGGRVTPFVKLRDPKNKSNVIAVDLDQKELELNHQADKVIVADINQKLPFPNQSVDIITSRYVFEHLQNLPLFLKESRRVLRKDGLTIHLFSCRYAPFALLNQILPLKVSHLLLQWFIPGGTDIHGFKTHYYHCTFKEITKLFKIHNLQIDHLYLSYYQSRYYSFFLPLYLISIIFELVLYYLKIKQLSSYILVVARKN